MSLPAGLTSEWGCLSWWDISKGGSERGDVFYGLLLEVDIAVMVTDAD